MTTTVPKPFHGRIFAGRSNPSLTAEICQHLGTELGKITLKTFPDSEFFVRIEENIRGRDVFIVQSTCPPVNDHLMELLIMIDAARRASAQRITAVLPFYGYARQDRKDQPRVPITAKLIANLLVTAGATRVLAMDLHAPQIQGFFDIPVDHLFALPTLLSHVRQRGGENMVVMSPDVGGIKMAAAYAEALKVPFGFVAKRRLNAMHVEAYNIVGDVKGRDVLLVDDLTETGGTLIAAAGLLKEHGAASVRAAVSHGILLPQAFERLRAQDALDEIITTNSVPVHHHGLPITVVSVADLLSKAISYIHHNESVTSLFEMRGY